jgi:hypothetical protein
MKFSQSSRYDRLLFAFLFVFVGPAEHCSLENFGGAWRTIAVKLRTFEKTNEAFDVTRWMLPIIRVAHECQRSRVAHFLQSRECVSSPSWSPNHDGRTNAANEWAWSPLAVSGVLHDQGGKQPAMLGMPRMMLACRA